MRIKDKRIDPANGTLSLNLDDDLKSLPPSDSRYILNMIERDGDNLALSPELGNIVRELLLAPGDNTVIGYAPYIEKNALILCVANSNDNHRILLYDLKDHFSKIVCESQYLGFDSENVITHANVVDNLFYWVNNGLTDGMKINIDRGLETYQSGSSGTSALPYPAIDLQTLEQIKYPPHFPPQVELKTEADFRANFINEGGYAFRYRYIYDDGEKSVFSPMSFPIRPRVDTKSLINLEHWRWNNFINMDTGAPFQLGSDPIVFNSWHLAPQDNYYNKVAITLMVGHNTVDRIEIAAFDPQTNIWFLIKSVDNQKLLLTNNPGDQVFAFTWYGDIRGEVIADEDIFRAEDIAPRKPKTQDYISANTLVQGNFLDGYNISSIGLSVEVKIESINVGDLDSSFSNSATSGISADQPNKVFAYTIPLSEVVEGNIIRFYYRDNTKNWNLKYLTIPVLTYIVTDEDAANGLSFLYDRLSDAFTLNRMIQKTLPQPQGGYVPTTRLSQFNGSYDRVVLMETGEKPLVSNIIERFLNYDPSGSDDPIVANRISFHNDTFQYSTFKHQASYKIGVVYKDRGGRRSSVITSKDCLVNISPFSKDKYSRVYLKLNKPPAPSWATSYDVVCTYNLTWLDWVQILYDENINTGEKSGWKSKTLLNNRGITNVQFITEIQRGYEFEIGDWISKVGEASRSNSGINNTAYYNWSVVYNNVHRLQQISAEIIPNGIIMADVTGFAIPIDLIEFSKRFNETTDEIFYETGLTLDVGQQGSIDIKNGDCWRRYRTCSAGTQNAGTSQKDHTILRNVFIEDPNWNDLIPSIDHKGRVYGVNDDFKEINQKNLIRGSGVFLEGTEINELNRWSGDREIKLLDEHGQINYIKEIGYVLKILQDRKNTSIYIGRQTPVNPDGTEDILLTDKVFGTVTPSNDNYGTTYPESVVIHNRHLYFFDQYYGQIIRDSPNGMFPISEYKAATLFKVLGDYLKGFPLPPGKGNTAKAYGKIRAGWNNDIDSYVFSFIQIPDPVSNELEDIPDFTISFKETENKWKSFHSYSPDLYANFGNTLLSFEGGKALVHNVNPIRCLFNGVRYPVEVRIPGTIEPDKVKTFESLSIQYEVNMVNQIIDQSESQKLEASLITIPPITVYGQKILPSDLQGMESKILAEQFIEREGVHHASFNRDLNTPNMNRFKINPTDVPYLLLDGRVMRGHICEISITGDISEELVLTRVIIESIKSEVSG